MMRCEVSVRGRSVSLTVSIGGINCRTGATVSELMRVADRRLYEAKRLVS
jgi:hypothetical protein